ncbi:MAG: Ribonuclease D, partial [uncultured Thermoleophilia bacterium]
GDRRGRRTAAGERRVCYPVVAPARPNKGRRPPLDCPDLRPLRRRRRADRRRRGRGARLPRPVRGADGARHRVPLGADVRPPAVPRPGRRRLRGRARRPARRRPARAGGRTARRPGRGGRHARARGRPAGVRPAPRRAADPDRRHADPGRVRRPDGVGEPRAADRRCPADHARASRVVLGLEQAAAVGDAGGLRGRRRAAPRGARRPPVGAGRREGPAGVGGSGARAALRGLLLGRPGPVRRVAEGRPPRPSDGAPARGARRRRGLARAGGPPSRPPGLLGHEGSDARRAGADRAAHARGRTAPAGVPEDAARGRAAQPPGRDRRRPRGPTPAAGARAGARRPTTGGGGRRAGRDAAEGPVRRRRPGTRARGHAQRPRPVRGGGRRGRRRRRTAARHGLALGPRRPGDRRAGRGTRQPVAPHPAAVPPDRPVRRWSAGRRL